MHPHMFLVDLADATATVRGRTLSVRRLSDPSVSVPSEGDTPDHVRRSVSAAAPDARTDPQRCSDTTDKESTVEPRPMPCEQAGECLLRHSG